MSSTEIDNLDKRIEAHKLVDALFNAIESEKWFGCTSLYIHSHGGTVKTLKEGREGQRG